MRIYVASLSDYNDGRLYGVWIDDLEDLDIDDVWDQINSMLEASPYNKDPWNRRHGLKAEEWAIHDYEDFGGIKLGESEPLERVMEIAKGIYQWDDAYIARVLDTGTTDRMDFEDSYDGEYESVEDFGYQWFDEHYGVEKLDEMDYISSHVDWETYGEGLLTGISHCEFKGKVYVFSK